MTSKADKKWQRWERANAAYNKAMTLPPSKKRDTAAWEAARDCINLYVLGAPLSKSAQRSIKRKKNT